MQNEAKMKKLLEEIKCDVSLAELGEGYEYNLRETEDKINQLLALLKEKPCFVTKKQLCDIRDELVSIHNGGGEYSLAGVIDKIDKARFKQEKPKCDKKFVLNMPDIDCPKCKRKQSMYWDGRAGIYLCPYHKCNHVVRITCEDCKIDNPACNDSERICSAFTEKPVCSSCEDTGKPWCPCGEFHPRASMCPPHEVRMKWVKDTPCPVCGLCATCGGSGICKNCDGKRIFTQMDIQTNAEFEKNCDFCGGSGNCPDCPTKDVAEFVAKMRKMRLCFTNNVGEKPYYRCEDEEMKVFVADDQLFCTIYPADFQGEYDEEVAIAFCEIGEVLNRAADIIESQQKAEPKAKDMAKFVAKSRRHLEIADSMSREWCFNVLKKIESQQK